MPKQNLPSPSTPPYRAARFNSSADHSTAIDHEINQLQDHLQHIVLEPSESPTLMSTAAILHRITLSLLSVTRLLHTHQILQSAGEPVIMQLEHALSDIARELLVCQEPNVASTMCDVLRDDPLLLRPLEEH